MPHSRFHFPLCSYSFSIDRSSLTPTIQAKAIIFSLLLIIIPAVYMFYNMIGRDKNNKLTQVKNPQDYENSRLETKNNRNTYVHADQRADFFKFIPTKYLRLNGNELPGGLQALTELSVRVTPGEYEPLAFLISANDDLKGIKIAWEDLSSGTKKLSREAIDPYVAKIWYQAGIKNTDVKNKLLTQELLLKNDALIKVDERLETNFIQVQNRNNEYEYIDISTPDAVFPEGVIIRDSNELLPFDIENGRNKLIWLTIHIPENQAAGVYAGTVNVSDSKGILMKIPTSIEVLPFKLSEPVLLYGIYYHGYYDNVSKRAFYFTNKTEKLYRAEMRDLREHGIMYPTTYQVLSNLDNDLRIRNEMGFPKDKLFSVGLKTGNPQSIRELETLVNNIKAWQAKIRQYGYDTLYIYGIDEAKGEILRSQRPAWMRVRQTGAKVFVAGYYETFRDMGDLLNIAIIQGSLNPEQARLYHSRGHRIFSYSNPQAGEENPEIYRRNFGLALWKAGYDGSMEYAYQKNYNSTWNDFDHPKYREENFTYPTSDGIIKTIQWEGFREGIDDVKYLSTLIDRIKELKSSGKNTTELENWMAELQLSGDLDQVRFEIIEKILSTF